MLLCLAASLQGSMAALASCCNPSTVASVLPSNATLIYARPYVANSPFNESASSTCLTEMPAFCAVYVNVTSSNSSSFEFAVWLPLNAAWNNRFLTYGNGGFIGKIAWSDMYSGLKYGFAVTSTNTGYNSTAKDYTSDWAYQAPEKRIDWGWRAMHGTVSLGKTLTAAFYNKTANYITMLDAQLVADKA